MNTDSLSLIISGVVGAWVGFIIGFGLMRAITARAAARATKDAWAAANVYYTRKSAEP